ncbi:GNAT family N-acetyltransferase [Acidisphaera sp. L21]|uniref:GNAT family N-acetyltransferase n=1 Tax=Acidisphaera sp. L21 TaxID=1641851 RepID=UPI00131BEA79|nr:GNAT family protein [Acidisphaera sp. L21]
MGRAEPDWAAIGLTALEAADAPRIHAWQNDPAIRDLTMGFRGPIASETTVEWIRDLHEQGLRNRAVFGIRHDGVLRGVVQLHTIDWVQRTAMLGLYVGDSADRGAGLGFAATSLILDYGFTGLDLHRIGLSVLATNLAADRLYQRLGFAREGTLRAAYFLAGQRVDVALYAMLQPDWPAKLPPTAKRLVLTPSF